MQSWHAEASNKWKVEITLWFDSWSEVLIYVKLSLNAQRKEAESLSHKWTP